MAEGLSFFGGVHLALDATLVSTHHGDGTLLRKSDEMDGVALQLARRCKETRCPELSGSHGRARLVVIAGEVGGRWSRETQAFLHAISGTLQGSWCTSHPSGERRGGVAQEVVHFAGRVWRPKWL